jgi:NADH dehydrogenase
MLRQRLLRSGTRLTRKQSTFASNLSNRSLKAAKYTGLLCLSTVVGVGVITTGILLHDVFTYTDKHVERVPVSPLALHPERGGPKNLPIARVYMDDDVDEENRKLATRPRLVIIGGGWGVSLSSLSLHRLITCREWRQ